MPDVLIVSGAGAYSDPWHPFEETTARIAEILAADASIVVDTDVVAALTGLNADAWDLVVLNLGSAGLEVATDAACVDGIERYLGAGGSLLVSHVAATAFPADPRWEALLGGRWVRGTSMHPPHSDAQIAVTDVAHEVLRDIDDFVLSDERYSYLRVGEDVTVLATHRHDDLDHPVIWARDRERARIVYDGLGHDARSYDSPDHRRLVRNAFRWLTAVAESTSSSTEEESHGR